MQRCADCINATDEREPEDDEPSYRCGVTVPFWVPTSVRDYESWVRADDGAKCKAFADKQSKTT
jgi:hypothetical protein